MELDNNDGKHCRQKNDSARTLTQKNGKQTIIYLDPGDNELEYLFNKT